MVLVLMNGEAVPESEARISVMDHGFLYGDMVYEVVKAEQQRFFALGPHLQRLRYSASMIDLPLPWDDAFLTAEMLRMVGMLGTTHSYLRLVITRGQGPLSLEPGKCGELTRILYGKELVPLNPAYYRDGVGLWVSKAQAADHGNIKSSVYRNNVQAIKLARAEGFHEALLLDRNGNITECTTSNIFWIKNGVLFTPALNVGILKGVTRQVVIHLASDMSLGLREGVFSQDALLNADEVFLTSTTRDVMPVSHAGDQTFPVGPITKELMQRFQDLDNVKLDWSAD